jgi:hypothetical protein
VTLPIPAGPDGLTAEWIGAALAASGAAEARVSSVSLEAIGAGSGFVGRLFRCRLTYDGGSGPATVIAKLPGEASASRALFQRFGLFEREVGFYRELQAKTPVPTPRCYFAGIEAGTGDFALLLEDMGEGASGDPLTGATAEQAGQALSLAAKMHARWWDDPALGEPDWMVGANAPRMKTVIAERYDEAWASFDSAFGEHLPGALQKLGPSLGKLLPQVLDRLSTPPVTLVHGDFQPANVFYSADGRIVGVGDWQVIVRARGAMDVSYFLVNGVDPTERRHVERDAVRDYHISLLANGVRGYPLRELWEDYRLAALSQFGLVIVLSHALNSDAPPGPEPEREALASVAGARLISAMTDLRPQELLEDATLWRRLAAFARRSVRPLS